MLFRRHVNSSLVSPKHFFYFALSFRCDHHFPRNFSGEGRDTMLAENDDMPIGWPLGLGFLNLRLRVGESLPAASVAPYQLHVPSISFSSFSSSNLDTESTASFFQDNSVSLAQLIGIRPGDRGRLYFPNSLRYEERKKKLTKGSCSEGSKVQGMDVSRVICIPLLKIRKSKKSSRN